jgi:hypothetical protein
MSLAYKIHDHAKKRVRERFGIKPEHVANWCNQALSNSVRAYKQEDGRTVFQHRSKEIFIVVDEADMLVVTLIDKPIEKVKVRSPFLDNMLPQLEREAYKMQRDFTRQRRALEKMYAEKVTERGQTLERRAAAKNPVIQAKLAADAKELDKQARAIAAQITQLKMDYEISVVKVESFIRSIKDEKDVV